MGEFKDPGLVELTTYRQTVQALRESANIYQTIFENSGTAIVIIEEDLTISLVNSQFERLAGRLNLALKGQHWLDYVLPEDREKIEAYHRLRREDPGATPTSYVFRLVDYGGNIWEILAHIALIPGTRKSIASLVDVTAAKKAEAALRAAHRRLEDIIEFLPDATFVIDQEQKVIAWNRAIERLSGVSKAEILGKGDFFYAVPFYGEARPILIDQVINPACDQPGLRYRNFKYQGKAIYGDIWVPFTDGRPGMNLWGIAAPLYDAEGNIIGAIESIRDISEQRQTIEQLRRTEERFAKTFQASPCSMAIFNRDGRLVDANSRLLKTIGYSLAEVLGRTPHELKLLVVPEKIHEIRALVYEHKTVDNWEFQFITKTGEIRDGLLDGSVIDLNGESHLLVVITDVTNEKQAVAELRFSEERFAKAFNASPLIMAITTLTEGQFIDVNESFISTYGYRREEVIGRTATELEIWFDPLQRSRIIQRIMAEGGVYDWVIEFRSKDGTARFSQMSIIPIEIAGSQYLMFMGMDVTEREQMQKEMARLDRLNLIGQMAAGIGHEIRNPMTTVRGFLQMLSIKPECNAYRDYFELMIDELDQANAIITEFLSLARNKATDLRLLNLNSIICSLEPLIRADANVFNQEVVFTLSPVPDLLLDKKEIRQLIFNLLRNGLEANGRNGKISLQTYREGEEIVLMIADEGPGFAPEILKKIGTPFLTNKDEGTGLGLPVCFSIAARHKAKLEVDSQPSGTTLTVRFPLADASLSGVTGT